MRRAVTLKRVYLNVKLSTKYVCEALFGDTQGDGGVSGAQVSKQAILMEGHGGQ